ncbi:ABC transporter permease, partial [Akkermansiaceae bacterium]|nr:ABC transporter permease [Akkermansiaceae bacterium]
MLKAALHEELDHESLILDLGEFGFDLGLDLMGLLECLDLSERQILEKEKFGGVRPSAYLLSKIAFLSTLIIIQSVWMATFVEFFWAFRGDFTQHVIFLILVNASMTSICLGISSLMRTAEQASLLSVYLVGFQLPLSGAILALPENIEVLTRPFISAYWSWSGS